MNDKLQSSVLEGAFGENSWQLPASPFEGIHAEPQDAASPAVSPQAAMPPDTSFLRSPPRFQPPAQADRETEKRPGPIPWRSVPTPQIGRQQPWKNWQEFGQEKEETDTGEYSVQEDDALPEGPEIEIPAVPVKELHSKSPSESERAVSSAEQMLQELDRIPRGESSQSFSSLLDYNAEYDSRDGEDDDEDDDGDIDPAQAAADFTPWPPQGVSEKMLYRDLNMRGLLKDLKKETDVGEDEGNSDGAEKAREPALGPHNGPDGGTASLLAEVEAFGARPAAGTHGASHYMGGEITVPPVQEKTEETVTEKKHFWKKPLRTRLSWRKRGAEDKAPAPRTRDGKPWRWKRLWKTALSFAAPLLAVVIVFQFIGFAVIDGASMTPSLSEHDFLIYWKFPGQIERGEVLLSRSAGYNNQIIAKRVIGLPGDIVEVDEEGRVLLNGEVYNETTAIYGQAELASDVNFPVRVEDNRYFVLGDNRAVSLDSRQSAIGQIDREDIVGEVICWFHIE